MKGEELVQKVNAILKQKPNLDLAFYVGGKSRFYWVISDIKYDPEQNEITIEFFDEE